MFKKYLSRFPFAISGLKRASLYDFGFRTQLYLGIVVAFVAFAFLLPLSQTELLFIILAYVLILITELQNSALESALDKIHPEHSENIKNSKDMAAASVLIAGGFLVIVLLIIGWSRFSF